MLQRPLAHCSCNGFHTFPPPIGERSHKPRPTFGAPNHSLRTILLFPFSLLWHWIFLILLRIKALSFGTRRELPARSTQQWQPRSRCRTAHCVSELTDFELDGRATVTTVAFSSTKPNIAKERRTPHTEHGDFFSLSWSPNPPPPHAIAHSSPLSLPVPRFHSFQKFFSSPSRLCNPFLGSCVLLCVHEKWMEMEFCLPPPTL